MRIAFILAAALMAAPALAADGHAGHDSGHEGHDMGAMEDTSRFGAPGDAAKASRTVTIKATEIAYDVKSLDVTAGETIVFVLENDGSQDHELGVGDDAFFQAHAKMMEQMPGMKHAMPNMVSTKPGETAKFAWTFTKAGAFKFECAMPGHAELGMVGAIAVN
jgi:uncharacterized cupredoxin-like copper-binding protein